MFVEGKEISVKASQRINTGDRQLRAEYYFSTSKFELDSGIDLSIRERRNTQGKFSCEYSMRKSIK